MKVRQLLMSLSLLYKRLLIALDKKHWIECETREAYHPSIPVVNRQSETKMKVKIIWTAFITLRVFKYTWKKLRMTWRRFFFEEMFKPICSPSEVKMLLNFSTVSACNWYYTVSTWLGSTHMRWTFVREESIETKEKV